MFTQRKTETALFRQMEISYMPRAYKSLTRLTCLETCGSQLRFKRRFCSSCKALLSSMSCFFSHKIALFLLLIRKSSYIFHLCQMMCMLLFLTMIIFMRQSSTQSKGQAHYSFVEPFSKSMFPSASQRWQNNTDRSRNHQVLKTTG